MYYHCFFYLTLIFNRPGVAGAGLQTPLPLIRSVSNSLTHPFPPDQVFKTPSHPIGGEDNEGSAKTGRVTTTTGFTWPKLSHISKKYIIFFTKNP